MKFTFRFSFGRGSFGILGSLRNVTWKAHSIKYYVLIHSIADTFNTNTDTKYKSKNNKTQTGSEPAQKRIRPLLLTNRRRGTMPRINDQNLRQTKQPRQ